MMLLYFIIFILFFKFLVDDKNMLEYIRSKTAAPYFSNLVWFIGNHVIELDSSLAEAK